MHNFEKMNYYPSKDIVLAEVRKYQAILSPCAQIILPIDFNINPNASAC